MKKFLILSAAALFAGSAMAEVTLVTSDTTDEMQLLAETMSPNGKYAAGLNFVTNAPCVWDVANNLYYDFAELEEGSFHAVANDGFACGDNGNFAIAGYPNGEMTTLFYNVGEEIYNEEWDFWYSTGDAGSSAFCMTADHETIFGFYYLSDYTTYPCYWRNGERFDLPVPTEEEASFFVNGAEVRWCTPDGSLLLGYVIDDMGIWPACLWRLQADGTYVADVICKDYFELDYGMGKPYMLFTPYGLSENGEWMSLCVQDEFDFMSDNWTYAQQARMNLKTGKIEVLTNDEISDNATPSGIANDGTMCIINNALMGMVGREAYVWPAGAEDAVLLTELTGEVEAFEGLLCNSLNAISADGKTLQGFAMVDNDNADIFSYVLDLGNIVNLQSVDRAEQPAVYYNLQGMRVNSINTPGLYIKATR